MKPLIILALIAPSIFAETKPAETPLPRDMQLELQLLVSQERAATEKLQAVAELVLGPIREAKQTAMEKACQAAGIPAHDGAGRPVCEIDIKEGKVRRAPSASKETK